MIVVQVELWPGGNPLRRRTLGSLLISNASNLAATSDHEGDYLVRRLDLHHNVIRSGAVRNHKRRQSVWSLVPKAIKATFR